VLRKCPSNFVLVFGKRAGIIHQNSEHLGFLENPPEDARFHVYGAARHLDNNIVERALKKAILNRRNALFYKTLNGAGVGDLFMSLIHTCELNGANPFDYLTELLRHAEELKRSPSEWMPWNYRETLARLAQSAAA
jgi:transposase